jgi:hypothetical protein
MKKKIEDEKNHLNLLYIEIYLSFFILFIFRVKIIHPG